jgi:polyferredoxin
MFVYAGLLTILLTALVTSIATRTPVILDVLRDRNTLYRELPGDIIENSYTIKILNQSNDPRSFRLSVDGVPGLMLDGVAEEIEVAGGGVLSLPVRARTQRDNAYGIMNITFAVIAVDDQRVATEQDSRFLGPTP